MTISLQQQKRVKIERSTPKQIATKCDKIYNKISSSVNLIRNLFLRISRILVLRSSFGSVNFCHSNLGSKIPRNLKKHIKIIHKEDIVE